MYHQWAVLEQRIHQMRWDDMGSKGRQHLQHLCTKKKKNTESSIGSQDNMWSLHVMFKWHALPKGLQWLLPTIQPFKSAWGHEGACLALTTTHWHLTWECRCNFDTIQQSMPPHGCACNVCLVVDMWAGNIMFWLAHSHPTCLHANLIIWQDCKLQDAKQVHLNVTCFSFAPQPLEQGATSDSKCL